ncbi:MAG TPA: hypothetical protein VGN90_08540 [Pyrinomonadaceae bacterium]|nr:hypothetical protein [Pyrinomonadaceae bacterium]
MDNPNPPHPKTPQEVADQIARKYFDVTDEASRTIAIRKCLVSVVWVTCLVPAIFYLRFRHVGPLGWGTTIFFDAYCLLAAVGLYFRPRTEYHSPVPLRGDWLDRVGAFWLVGCVFGPFFGWIVTSGTFPITFNSWRWLYGLRLLLAAGLPILLALPLTRYARGKSSWIALPLLFGVTLLPVLSAMNVSWDLWEGPVACTSPATGERELFLQHSGQRLNE